MQKHSSTLACYVLNYGCILWWTDSKTFLICLKVKLPREYIKLSPISSAIIPHRAADGRLTKTGYVKLSAFSQVLSLEDSKIILLFYDLAYYHENQDWLLGCQLFCNDRLLINQDLFCNRVLLLIWKMQFMKWKVRMSRHIYLIWGIIL